MATAQASLVDKVGVDGMVQVFDTHAKCFKRVPHVDAKEMLKAGTALMLGPEVEMVGPAGRVKVPRDQVEARLGDGLKLVDSPKDKFDETAAPPKTAPVVPEQKEKVEPEGGKTEEPKPEPYDFTKHTVQQLKEMASKAGVQDFDGMNKGALCAALDAAKFDPRA